MTTAAQTEHARKVGLALSGGTLKATAHVGVLDALESMGVHVDAIAGTSAGSYVATLYAHGVRPIEMMDMIRNFPGLRLLDYGFPLWSSLLTLLSYRLLPRRLRHFGLPSGLLRGRKLERYFRQALKDRPANIPFYVIATDLATGSPVVYGNHCGDGQSAGVVESGLPSTQASDGDRGWPRTVEPINDIANVIRGSCSLPGIFTPVKIGRHLVVDGGLRSYVPVEVLREHGCTHIVAVNLYHLEENWQPETFAHVLARSFDIILDETIDGDVKGKDVFSVTPNVSQMSWISLSDMRDSVDKGRTAVMDQRAEIQEFLSLGSVKRATENTKRTRKPMPPVLKIAGLPSEGN